MLWEFLRAACPRGGVAFLTLMLAGFAVSLVIEPENVFQSDDPYLGGFLIGSFAAAASLVYSLAILVWRSRLWASASYFVLLLAWSCFCLGLAVVGGGEGAAIAIYFSVASLAVGTIAFPLYFWKPRPWVIAILTALSLILLAGYVRVAIRMNSHAHRHEPCIIVLGAVCPAVGRHNCT